MKILCVVGARPNFVKISPIIKELKKHKKIETLLVHTGQHYEYNLSKSFFEDLNINDPNIFLDIHGGSHGEQTGKTLIEFEKVLLKEKPNLVIVVGDVNSTLACALASKKLGIKIAHIEAGLRSFNWNMPEEINRVIVDRISDYLFITEREAVKNLRKEGLENNVFFVGNIMIDSIHNNLDKIKRSDILKRLDIKPKEYILFTTHRPENVDSLKNLKKIVSIILALHKEYKIVLPLHPRTKKNLEIYDLFDSLIKDSIILVPPIRYVDFIKLEMDSLCVLTDSGGIQEETTFLGIPCLTLREETERPITVTEGTNKIVGLDYDKIISEIKNLKLVKKRKVPELWDGRTAERIVDIIRK